MTERRFHDQIQTLNWETHSHIVFIQEQLLPEVLEKNYQHHPQEFWKAEMKIARM